MTAKPSYEELEETVRQLSRRVSEQEGCENAVRESSRQATHGADITDRTEVEKALRDSEERWQFALEGAGDGVWDWNAQTNRVFFSRQWKAMLGFEEHEIGDTLDEWDKRIHPEDRERAYADIEGHFSGKTPFYANEHRLRCKDGTYKWVYDRGKVISRTAEGRPLRVIGTHEDITERKRAEDELRQAHERMEMLLYSLPNGILVIDEKTHRIMDANPRASLMIGLPVDQIVGKTCHRFVCPSESGKCPVSDLAKTVENSERLLITADGEEIPILKTVLRVDLDGRECLIECFSDLSQVKHAELVRVEKERLQAVVETAGAVCHEMNQPLMAISGYSELLEMRGRESQEATQYARKIRAQVERMAAITKKLMAITGYRTKRYLDGRIIDIDGASDGDE